MSSDRRDHESQVSRPGVMVSSGEDQISALQRQLLKRLIVGQTVAVSLLAGMTTVGGVVAPQSGLLALTPLGAVAAAVGLVSWFLLSRDRARAASYVFLIGTALAITSNVYVRGYEDASAIYYLWPILGAGALLETWGGGLLAVISAFLYVALVLLQRSGVLVPPMPYVAQQEVLLTVGSRVLMFFLLSFLGWLSSRNLVRALQRAQWAGQELRELNEALERRVSEQTVEVRRRASYLGATTAVAQEAAAVRGDTERLLRRTVELIAEQFGFYHVGLFMLDPEGEMVALHAASSEGGRAMLARGHRLRVGQGIVGTVVQQGTHRVALNVRADAAFVANPDLPETEAEMAVPLRARGAILGALDAQSTSPDAFTEDDVTVMQALADQLALAIDGARLFRQTEESVEAGRRAMGELTRERWMNLLQAQPDLGYLSDGQQTVPAGELWRDEMRDALRTGQVAYSDGEEARLAVPVRVRDQVVGVIDGRKRDGTPWSREERGLLEEMVGQLNVALEGAQLYRQTQQRAAREQAIGQVTSSIRQSLEIDDVLRTAAEQIRETLGLGKAVVRLAVPEDVSAVVDDE